MENGQIFDNKYKILKMLGKGGMGAVYLAENIRLGTLWAIKEINKNLGDRFDILMESNILKKLNHPALPRIFDVLENEENIYIIVDYIEGATLDEELERAGRFNEEMVIAWAKQICGVYLYLHGQRPNPIIYRDMKPSNIILARDGSIKLIDFGIARENKAGSDTDTTFIGTRGFAAPEQYGAGQTNAASDIYSLGATIYYLLTKIHPGLSVGSLKPIRQVDRSISKGLAAIVEKCIRLDPAERYCSAQDLLDDLQALNRPSWIRKRVGNKTQYQGYIPEDYKKVVGFVGSPESGTTTVVIALSEYFSSRDKKVSILDCTSNRRLYEIFGWGHYKAFPEDAQSCNHSLEQLANGILNPLELDKGRNLYISNGPVDIKPGSYIDMMDHLRNTGDIILADMDFQSDLELVKNLNHLYVVKDMNLYNAKETSEYLQALHTSGVPLSKIRVIVSKFLNCALRPKTVADTATAVLNGEEYEMLTEERPPIYILPYEVGIYQQFVENVTRSSFTFTGAAGAFKESIEEIAHSIYPLMSKKYSHGNGQSHNEREENRKIWK